jgi:hypothetical protein
MSCNLGDMMLAKCVFHSIGRATKDDAVAADGSVIVAAVEVVESDVTDFEVLEQFCVLFVDERAAGEVAGLEIETAVAELESQYL